jgi:arylsulfatase A-like enzyme
LLKLQSQAGPADREDLIALHLHDQTSLLESLDQWLGLLDKETLVAFVGSSGFELGEQGRLGSGTSMGEEALAVPFMLLGPGIPVGQVQRRVGHVDLMPTLLDLAGLPGPRDLAGVSILPGRSAAWRPLFSSTRRAHSRDVVYEEGLKLLRDGETGDCSLYDLDRDPDELMEHGTRLGSDRTRLRQVLLDHLERP